MPEPGKTQETIDMLRDEVEKKGMIDISYGVEKHLNLSETSFLRVQRALRQEGYRIYVLRVLQHGAKAKVLVKVLCPKGMTEDEAKEKVSEAKQVA